MSCLRAGDPVKAAEEMRSVVKALPEGDSKADEDCPICMEAVVTGDWQVGRSSDFKCVNGPDTGQPSVEQHAMVSTSLQQWWSL